MNATLLLVAFAILLTGIGILLWQHATTRARQQQASQVIDRHLQELQPATNEWEHAPLFPTDSRPQSVTWKYFLLRAGIQNTPRFHAFLFGPGIALVAMAAFFLGAVSAIAVFLLYILLCYFRLWFISVKRHQKMVRQLPAFLDTMVRLATIGNSIESAFQSAVLTADAPLRDVLDRANRLVQAGMNLEHALMQEARIFRIVELELIAAVIGVALRFGGRADKVLERMGAFMRDREQAQNELVALSAETRLSAWILALLPIGLGLFMMIFNDKIFSAMLEDPAGRNLLIGAALLEIVGAIWLYRLAKSV
ncbi:type II secretion system F family protein [uncultured Oxalicibacterium sp.]|uniref:type II secretion system F family protein n=1 Tax=uncultured Oxalicibacterium sp. TaxID=1168540 RepID=UPI0025D4F2C3|nr:type II secretion system F family protein [uncultured Oxalicibacterium sp.]